jgi:hypothetical protein
LFVEYAGRKNISKDQGSAAFFPPRKSIDVPKRAINLGDFEKDFILRSMFGFYDRCVALGGLVVSVLATGPKVRGFKPGR